MNSKITNFKSNFFFAILHELMLLAFLSIFLCNSDSNVQSHFFALLQKSEATCIIIDCWYKIYVYQIIFLFIDFIKTIRHNIYGSLIEKINKAKNSCSTSIWHSSCLIKELPRTGAAEEQKTVIFRRNTQKEFTFFTKHFKSLSLLRYFRTKKCPCCVISYIFAMLGSFCQVYLHKGQLLIFKTKKSQGRFKYILI